MRIIVLAKERPGLDEALLFLQQYDPHLTICRGVRGDPFPFQVFENPPTILVSYLAPWIVPAVALRQVTLASVNFHPGPPEYPGTGCTNFALYDEATEFGVTAHLMEAKVDSGAILKVSRFAIQQDESVHSLTQRCYVEIQKIFPEVMARVAAGDLRTAPEEYWRREPYTRRQLEELCRVSPDMSEREVRRRVRATVYPGMPGPFIELHGYRFELRHS